ncbi:hypothetical protein [Phenylobacterium sp.]|uniref:hypothetical protein n=1 Tax=Phenylobacterium sp. TaxID=1871053 RepID=UPI003BA9A3EA
MRKILTSGMVGVIAAGAVLATAGPAFADRRHYRHHRGGGDDEVAAAILGGVAGLALGAALSNGGNRRDRGGYYYDNGYRYDPRYDRYSGGYGAYDPYDRPYRYRERTCITRERVYDPYIGRRVTIERRYPC